MRQMVGVSDRRGFCIAGKVLLVKKKLYVSRRFAVAHLGVEIYRFEVSMYRIGEIVVFCAVFMHFDHLNIRISQSDFQQSF